MSSISIGSVPTVPATEKKGRERGTTYVLASAFVSDAGEIVAPTPDVSRVMVALVTVYGPGSLYTHVGGANRSRPTKVGGFKNAEILHAAPEFLSAVAEAIHARTLNGSFDASGLDRIVRASKGTDA